MNSNVLNNKGFNANASVLFVFMPVSHPMMISKCVKFLTKLKHIDKMSS